MHGENQQNYVQDRESTKHMNGDNLSQKSPTIH